jgi:hypothetical protein
MNLHISSCNGYVAVSGSQRQHRSHESNSQEQDLVRYGTVTYRNMIFRNELCTVLSFGHTAIHSSCFPSDVYGRLDLLFNETQLH